MSFPTYSPEVDRQILAKKPLHQLTSICSTNTYLKNLCNSNEFWFLKLQEFKFQDYERLLVHYSPKETYLEMLRLQQALDRFHSLVQLNLIEMGMDAVHLYTDQGISFKISNQGQAGSIIDLFCIQEDRTPGGDERLEGDVQYNLLTREIIGTLVEAALPGNRESAVSLIQIFFGAPVVY